MTVESEIMPRVGEHILLKIQQGIYEVVAIVHHLPDDRDLPTLWVEESSVDDAIRARRVPQTKVAYDSAYDD